MKSIKDIAIKANVSTGTVDRVIHNRGGVSEKTRLKVQKIIDESNFEINPVASSLASKKEYKIATLIPESTYSEFWKLPKEGIQKSIQEAKSYGVTIIEFEFNQFSASSYTDCFNKIVAESPAGVLIAPLFLKETKEFIFLLEEHSIPYVFINIEIEGLNNLSFVGQNSYRGGFLAGKMLRLITQKDTDITIVEFRKNIENHNSIQQRIEGFINYFNKNKPETTLHILTINSIENTTETAKSMVSHLAKYPNSKSFFIPSSNASVIASYFDTEELDNIKLIGFDGLPDNIRFLKKERIDFLISQKPFEQGYDGIKILVNYLVHQKMPDKSYFSPIEIIAKENVDFMGLY